MTVMVYADLKGLTHTCKYNILAATLQTIIFIYHDIDNNFNAIYFSLDAYNIFNNYRSYIHE